MDWFALRDVEGRIDGKSGGQHEFQCCGTEHRVNFIPSNIPRRQFSVKGFEGYIVGGRPDLLSWSVLWTTAVVRVPFVTHCCLK